MKSGLKPDMVCSMKERFIIQGGNPLRGEVEVRGSKNAATKMIIASLLTEGPCELDNVPRSLDVEITYELCERIGSNITWIGAHRLRVETPEIKTSSVPELSRKNRIPILALGPLLHRKKTAEIPVLGGCPLGHRPINFHIEALNRMGARIERRENSYYAEADKLHGAEIAFPFSSVGATENVILAAVLAEGHTIIENAAMEPEIINTVKMLQEMGARIYIKPELRKIEIDGVSKLNGVSAKVMPDRNEVVSFASGALATDGDILIRDITEEHILTFLEAVKLLGADYAIDERGIRFFGTRPYRELTITTGPHPNFMTDWQQPFSILLTQAHGESIIHETVYDDRLGYTKDLNRMGASILLSDECLGSSACRFLGQTFNHSARIKGLTPLAGRDLVMQDIRAGMAYIIAAMASSGESVVTGIEHVDRGYERIDERLRELGADIKRVSG